MREKSIAKHVEVRIILQVDVILGTRFVSNVLRRGMCRKRNYQKPKKINAFCRKLNASSMSKQTENFVNELKSEFNKVFADELGCCTKTEVRFELKETSIQAKKKNPVFIVRNDRHRVMEIRRKWSN